VSTTRYSIPRVFSSETPILSSFVSESWFRNSLRGLKNLVHASNHHANDYNIGCRTTQRQISVIAQLKAFTFIWLSFLPQKNTFNPRANV
jgi:hypothetical protein